MMMTFYEVAGLTRPRTPDMRQTVGYYEDKETAEKVVKLLQEKSSRIPGGVQLFVTALEAKVHAVKNDLVLPGRPDIVIQKMFSQREEERVKNFTFKYTKTTIVKDF